MNIVQIWQYVGLHLYFRSKKIIKNNETNSEICSRNFDTFVVIHHRPIHRVIKIIPS